MSCLPLQAAPLPPTHDGRERLRSRATALVGTMPPTEAAVEDPANRDAAMATNLMDLYRRTGDREVFDVLVEWVGPVLFARIRSRLRGLGAMFDPHEILQDTIVNIYRYPDRFLASRPGAFAAWSSTIVDNAIRRQLRQKRQGFAVALSAPEQLQEHADTGAREPSLAAQDHEECAATASAFGMLLLCYLNAFQTLAERERFVLQMVEVKQMRYAELATLLGIRPEALKMVVFRARKRIFDRTAALLAVVPSAGERSGRAPQAMALV
jgi:RNA polymerase sigma factor (sigma-70 family)